MNWEEFKLGDIVSIKHGYAFKGEFFVDTPTENILLTPGNFNIGGGFKKDKLKYYLGKVPQDYILSEGDIIVTMTDLSKMTDTLGFSARIPKDNSKTFLHNQRIGLVQLIDDAFDIGFMYWLMRSAHYQQFVAGSATGATVKHTSPSKIYAFKFKAPFEKSEQQKIAHILSAYDDLIENNLKRIKLLEEMAQITYEEWFVRMKFPGCEQAVIDPETGLPEGWKQEPLSNVTIYINRGMAPKYVEEDGYFVINQKCIRNKYISFEEARLTLNKQKTDVNKLLRRFDILVNSTGTGTLGRVAQLMDEPDKATVDTHVTIVRAKDNISALYLGRTLELLQPLIESLGKGATNQQELGRADLASIVKVIVPSKKLQLKFDAMVLPIYMCLSKLRVQNQRLKEARDILLPRLMTGLIDVNSLEIPEPLEAEKEVAQ